MELIEFQGRNIWKNTFINLNNELENNQIVSDVKSESLFLIPWRSLPNLFASMKKLVFSLLTMFGSTYVGEQLFS